MKNKSLNEEVKKIRKIMGITEEINHIYQPTGHSCGPTCIKMVGDFIKGDVGSIDDICHSCGTDWIVGTPPDKMKIGLNELQIKYIEHINENDPFQTIKSAIDKGNVCIIRTITKEIPHWIVIDAYIDNIFSVNDPWLGQITYNTNQLDKIWSPRDYFFFEIITNESNEISENLNNNKIILRKMNDEDIPIIFNMLSDVFYKTKMSNEEIWEDIDGYSLDLSIVVELNGEIIGFYFIAKNQIPPGGKDYDFLKDLNGIEGVALGVLPKVKNLGIGKKLILYPQTIAGVDYIWGMQYKSLENIDDWLKRRKIYLENPDFYTTYQLFRN